MPDSAGLDSYNWMGYTFRCVNGRDIEGRLLTAGPAYHALADLDLPDEIDPALASAFRNLGRGGANLLSYSEWFDSWSRPSVDVFATPNTTFSPTGTLTADTLTQSAVGAYIFQYVFFTGDGEKVVSVYLKQGTAGLTDLAVWDVDAAVFLHRVRATWTAGVPALSTADGAGTLFTPDSLGSGWYRIGFTVDDVIAAHFNQVRIYPSPTASSAETTIAWGAQAENAVVVGTYEPTNLQT